MLIRNRAGAGVASIGVTMQSEKRAQIFPGTGVNDHTWEREHRHPTPDQLRAMGSRRRDAEAKLDLHQEEARLRHPVNQSDAAI